MRTTSILLLFVVTLALGGTKFKERRAVDLRQKNLLVQQRQLPSVEYAKAITQKVTTGPLEGIEIGTTDYDYAINSGFARRIASYDNGNKVHMVYPQRDITKSSPDNNLTNVFVFWDAAAPATLTTTAPRPKVSGSAEFAGIDVIPAGDGAGIALMTYTSSGKTYFAIDGSPGGAAFTESEMPAAISGKLINDPQVTVTPDGSTIWFTANLNYDDVIVARTVDYGGTWIGIDSLKKYLPHAGFSINGAAPILISSDGTLYRIATLTGKGSLPPLGSAHPDSADCIGYFKSTNNGTTWSWMTIGRDGEPLVVSLSDTVYVLFENFSQFSGDLGTSGMLHIVSNGYCLKKINDSTLSNRFYTLYLNQSDNVWKIISNKAHGAYSDFDSSYYRYSGNAIGHPYPSIACKENNINVIWSQPVFSSGRLDTSEGFVQYQLWQSYSFDNSAHWGGPTIITGTDGALFSSSAEPIVDYMYSIVPMIFMKDTVAGNSVFNEGETKIISWIYKHVGGGGIVDYYYVTIISWADSGGTIEPAGEFQVPNHGVKTFTVTPDSGYQIDSVVVNNVNRGAVTAFTFQSPDVDQFIRAYFSPITSSVGNEKNIPLTMALYDNYPNPFNPTTTIHYDLDRDADVSIEVYDMLGRRVGSLIHEYKKAGKHTAAFDGSRLSSGTYYYKMTAGNYTAVKKMVLMK
ncbi:MAG: T9SS type A sorting domain-containing protein [Bacteroidota bacterium]